jgi:hypothetical protein
VFQGALATPHQVDSLGFCQFIYAATTYLDSGQHWKVWTWRSVGLAIPHKVGSLAILSVHTCCRDVLGFRARLKGEGRDYRFGTCGIGTVHEVGVNKEGMQEYSRGLPLLKVDLAVSSDPN